MPSKKKIFVVVPSPTGHLNPVVSLITELRKKHDVECIFYGNQENREQIEKTGSQFRLYANRNMCELVHDEKTQDGSNAILNVFHKFIDMSYELVPQLVRDARVEKPDIIIYEACFFPAHYLVEILKKENMRFKEIEFYPYFAVNKTIFTRLTNMKFNFNMVLSIITLFLRQFLFSWKFRIHIYNPLSIVMNKNNNPKLVSVFPELQPCREEFDKTYNFIGPCVSEQSRSQSFKSDPEIDSLLELFPPKGDSTKSRRNDLKLIYMSLGTVFNNLPFIFENTFEAIRDYDTKGYNLKSSQFRMVISLGETSYIKIKERVESGDFKIPENILIRPRVPQLEILKRADLFITHCGMNSTSEAIKYAVPMIAIPIEADQPMVARRVCDELSLGIRLNSLTITVDKISNAIDQMLSDEKYKRNIQKLSEVSSNYNGQVEGVKIISEYLN